MFTGGVGFNKKRLILTIKNLLCFTDYLDDNRAGNPLENVLFPSEKASRKAKQTPRMVAAFYR